VNRSVASRIALFCGVIFGIAMSSCIAQERVLPTSQPDTPARHSQNPDLLSFADLVALASTGKPEGALGERLDALLNTPFVQTENTAVDIQPHRPNVPGLGVILRVSQWNIERGLNFDLIRAALADPNAFLRMTRRLSDLIICVGADVMSQHDPSICGLGCLSFGAVGTISSTKLTSCGQN
jgi:hypothetical protein